MYEKKENKMKKLLEFLEKIERRELGLAPTEKKLLDNYVKNNRKTKDYCIEFLGYRFSVYCCSKLVFKGIYGFSNYSRSGIETFSKNEGATLLCLDKDDDPYDIFITIFVKSWSLVGNIKKIFDIKDSETEAYLYGWAVSSIVRDFIGEKGLKELFGSVEERKTIYREFDYASYVSYIMSATGVYRDVNWDVITGASGSVFSRTGLNQLLILIPRSTRSSAYSVINTFAHELYHLVKDAYGIFGYESYTFKDSIVKECVENCLPVLKYLLKKKL